MSKVNIDELMNHELYTRNQKALKEVTEAQIIKGYEKYGEPLKSSEWSGKQLIRHAREELVDLGHYIAALEEKIEFLSNEVNYIETKIGEIMKENRELKTKLNLSEMKLKHSERYVRSLGK